VEGTDYPTVRRLGGSIVDLKRFVDPTDRNWSATNPSIGHHPRKGYAVALRSSNYVIRPNGTYEVTSGDKIRARVWFAELDDSLKPKRVRQVDVSDLGVDLPRGLEDPKLFFRDGSWWFTCVTMEEHTPVARMAVARLDAKCTRAVELTRLPGIDAKRPEKNWMLPYDPNPNFDFVYGPNATVKDGVLRTVMTDHPAISALRGNTNLHALGDGTYIAVVHRMFGKADTVWVPQTFGTVNTYQRNYVHYFARYDEEGTIVSLSRGFQFHSPGVEFAAGITVRERQFLVSFGRGDVSSHIAVLPIETVMKSLVPIQY
jgi:hypothetical protein